MSWAPLTMRRNLVYEKLNISPALVRLAPPISSQIRMVMQKLKKRRLPASPYYYLKCAAGDEARKITELYYSIPKDRRNLAPIEAYCIACGISPTDLLDLLLRTIAVVTRQTSMMLAAATHGLVVDKTIDMALTDEGVEDRTLLHKAVGFLPAPRGAQTVVNVAANASSTAAAASAAIPAPPPEQTIRRLVDRFNDSPRALGPAQPSGIPVATPIDAEFAMVSDANDDADDASEDS